MSKISCLKSFKKIKTSEREANLQSNHFNQISFSNIELITLVKLIMSIGKL